MLTVTVYKTWLQVYYADCERQTRQVITVPAGGSAASQSLSLQQPRAKSASVTQSVVSQDDGIEAVFSLPSAKLPSSEACNRSTCQWPDPHTENCAKQAIVRRCEAGLCVMEDNHRCFPNCTKLSFYVNCKKVADGMYKYFDATVKKMRAELRSLASDKLEKLCKTVCKICYPRIHSDENSEHKKSPLSLE